MFRTREDSLVPPESLAYTSAEVARIARVSLRQLQWWDERRVVSPGQDNHKRLYRADQVIEVAVIAELRRKGLSLQNIRRVLRFLEKELRKRLSEALAPDSEIHLLTDGKSIYLEDGPERIMDLLKDARQGIFLVCVTDQTRRLVTAAQRKPAKSEAPGLARRSTVA